MKKSFLVLTLIGSAYLAPEANAAICSPVRFLGKADLYYECSANGSIYSTSSECYQRCRGTDGRMPIMSTGKFDEKDGDDTPLE